MAMFHSLPFKLSKESGVRHTLYLKEHQTPTGTISEAIKPIGRTLFVVGVPQYCDEELFTSIFGEYGPVDRVLFQKHPGPNVSGAMATTSKFFDAPEPIQGFKVAYVIFEKPTGLKAAIGASSSTRPKILFDGATREPMAGIKKWTRDYCSNLVEDVKELQAEVDSFMATHDAGKQREKDADVLEESAPDAEGWSTVTRRGKKPGIPRNESIAQKIRAKERNKEANDFYKFQFKESKMKSLDKIQEKFEEDKKRVASMKTTRKFKPY